MTARSAVLPPALPDDVRDVLRRVAYQLGRQIAREEAAPAPPLEGAADSESPSAAAAS